MTPMVLALETLRDALAVLAGDEYDIGTECNINPPPCRVAIYPSGSSAVPWDTCGEGGCGDGHDGQLWASVSAVNNVAVQGQIQSGPCAMYIWTGEVGIVRCEKATLSESGAMPPPHLVEADADRQAADADAILHALTCCPTRPERLRDIEMLAWTPLGPSGGCVGGVWTVRGVLEVCC